MSIINNFLTSLCALSLAESAEYLDGSGYVVSQGKNYLFSIKDKGFAITSINQEWFCPRPEATALKVLSRTIFGTTDAHFADKDYKGVTIFPKKIQSDSVVFSTADGREFILSSDNSRVTLGLYDLLYSHNAEHSILMLPELLPTGSDTVKIASSKVTECYVCPRNAFICSDLDISSTEGCYGSEDISILQKINSSLGDTSELGVSAPDVDTLLSCCQNRVLQSNTQGYTLSGGIQVGDITYAAEVQIKPDFALVQSLLLANNATVDMLESGVRLSDLTASGFKALTQSRVAVSEATGLRFVESSNPSASTFWGLPFSGKVTSFVWR